MLRIGQLSSDYHDAGDVREGSDGGPEGFETGGEGEGEEEGYFGFRFGGVGEGRVVLEEG